MARAPNASMRRAVVVGLLCMASALERRRKIAVVGSANFDTTYAVGAKLPTAGETVVTGGAPATCCGGKGLNPAVAAARVGDVDVEFAARVGDDAAADAVRSALADAGVGAARVAATAAAGTGLGVVLLEDGGEVLSVVVRGANFAGWDGGEAWDDLVAGASVLLLQREIPEAVNAAAAAAARRAGGVIVLQDAGGEDRPLDPDHVANCDYLSPNLSELRRLVGADVSLDGDGALDAACRSLIPPAAATKVLLTLGARGSRLVSREGPTVASPAVPGVAAVDATAAGDAFRAAFAVALAEGRGEGDALELAAAAGAAAVSKAGALPSLPTLGACDAMLVVVRGCGGGPRPGGGFPSNFASRLNSMKDRRDLAGDHADDVLGWVARQGTIAGLDHVDFNFPQHLAGLDAGAVAAALAAAGLTCGAVCLRCPSPEFSAGALTHPDAAVRAKAVALTVEACDRAAELGTDEVVVWSAFDGYDYAFQCDYDDLWARLVASFRAVCDARPATRVSLEFKPTDEHTRWFAVPSTGAALLLCADVDRANFGLTLDVGHCLAAGENPAQSVAAVAARGRLFGVQLNDGYTRLGAEDGLIFGSVHALAAREVVYWLRRARFAGHVYFDTFPRNEDPVRECELNIRQVRRLYDAAGDLDVADAQRRHDALGVLELLEARGDL